MFDESRGVANGRFFHPEDLQKLPAELEPVHELLVAASEEWRAALPVADRLADYARGLADAPAHPRRRELHAARPEAPSALLPASSNPALPARRTRALPVIAVTVAVVVLLGGCSSTSAQYGSIRPSGSLSLPTPSPTTWATPNGVVVPDGWRAVLPGLVLSDFSQPNTLVTNPAQPGRIAAAA
jgi:hypothetical protein